MITDEKTGYAPFYDESAQVPDNAWREAAYRLGERFGTIGPPGYYTMDWSQWLEWASGYMDTVKQEYSAIIRDAERYQWLRREHDRAAVLARVCWKRNGRADHEWVDVGEPRCLDELIDREMRQEKP